MQFDSALRSSPKFGTGGTNVYLVHRTDLLDRRVGNDNRVEKVPGSGTSITAYASGEHTKNKPSVFQIERIGAPEDAVMCHQAGKRLEAGLETIRDEAISMWGPLLGN